VKLCRGRSHALPALPTEKDGQALKRKIVATAIAALAAVVLLPGAGHAGTNSGWVYTTDGNPGGKGAFGESGDFLRVCDDQEDGWGVRIHLFRMDAFRDIPTLTTTQGAPFCKIQGFDSRVPENIGVGIRVCLKRGHTERFCQIKHNLIS
jgi:hypothetical protein